MREQQQQKHSPIDFSILLSIYFTVLIYKYTRGNILYTPADPFLFVVVAVVVSPFFFFPNNKKIEVGLPPQVSQTGEVL